MSAFYDWPEWVPESVRQEIERFWAPPGRSVRSWLEDAVRQGAPAFGELVYAPRLGSGAGYARGRYVHCWNNIGRVIDERGDRHYVSFPTTHCNSRQVAYEEWLAEGEQLFGSDRTTWRFQCASCGNIQSIVSVTARNPGLDPEEARAWIGSSCEGRHTEGVGCDWTLYGLFAMQSVAVLRDGVKYPAFEFAKVESAP